MQHHFGFAHDDRSGHFEKIIWSDGRSEEVAVSRLSSIFTARYFRAAAMVLALLAALLVGFAVPALASGPQPQAAPIEGSIVPTLVQIILIVLVTEGIKSLLKAFTNGATALQGREAAIAYVVVGILVYSFQTYLIPALSPSVAAAVANLFTVLAILLAGSGLFSMTSAFRISSNPDSHQK